MSLPSPTVNRPLLLTSTNSPISFYSSFSLISSSSPPFSSSVSCNRKKRFPLSPISLDNSRLSCFPQATQEDSSRDDVASPTNNDLPGVDSPSLGIREPIYEVVEVRSDGLVSTRKINRRQLLKSSGLRPRDIRSVDPSLFLTNSMPSLLVREYAILLNLGSLRAIAMQECVLVFDYNRKGGKAFVDTLLPRLNPKIMNGGPSMPFELEALLIKTLGCGGSVAFPSAGTGAKADGYRTSCECVDVQALLEVLPNKFTADVLEELRISKQKLVELGSKAGSLRQMLLDLLEDTHEIRRMCIMGRNCTLHKGDDEVECSVPLEKQIAEEEEEEIEMLLENYLQRSLLHSSQMMC